MISRTADAMIALLTFVDVGVLRDVSASRRQWVLARYGGRRADTRRRVGEEV